MWIMLLFKKNEKTTGSLKLNKFKIASRYTMLSVMVIVPATMISQHDFAFSIPDLQIPISGHNISKSTDSSQKQYSSDSFNDDLKLIGLSSDSITAVTFDKDGRTWIGSDDGLWVYDGKFFHEYTYKDGLFDKYINQLYCSSKGQIWVATRSGPYVLIENHFYVFTPLKNLNIYSISESSTNFYFLTENGIRVFGKDKDFFELFYIQILIIVLILIGSVTLLLWGLNYYKSKIEWKANLIRIEQDALLAQMNPHFIFNSLNSVQKYILANDKESAQDYLQKFASMMRMVLENSGQSRITLSEEIAALELYLQLESLRFDNGFDYEITVQEKDIWQFEIPPMLLHTFVENAVWHGLMNKEGRGEIKLRFSKLSNKVILCEIEDNGIGRKKAAEYKSKSTFKHKSKGTEIVKKRIELLNLKSRQKITCKTIDLEKIDTERTGTLVRLEIPVTLM